jgi:hypothetical protein
MTTIQETIAQKQKAMIPMRLLKGSEVLGRLWRSQVRCRSEWAGLCPCAAPGDFCTAKLKWLGLVRELHGGKYPYDLSGLEGLLVLECMDAKMFEATGLTILLALPGVRAPLRIGRSGTCGRTIIDLVAIPDGPDRADAIEAVIRIQEVGK